MASQELLRDLHTRSGGRILLLVADGLGGLGAEPGGPTELEAASTPNLDSLAADGVTGLLDPVAPGITPGSGPGHLALFGYDPVQQLVGRGVLAALGIDFPLEPGDVAARGNFCTVDEDGIVRDRRAGRPSTDEGRRLAEKLRDRVTIEGVELFVEPVKEHRFLLVLRAGDRAALSADIVDTDPHRTGVPPHEARPRGEDASRTAELVQQFVSRAHEALADEERANMVLLRGFASLPDLPDVHEVYGLTACAVAAYPMYRGLARLLGMDIASPPADLDEATRVLADRWSEHDFFFLHHKPTDSAGEDGDFDAKVRELERLDAILPTLRELGPDVLVVTGDHSTPARLAGHSWHPVPVLLHATTCRRDDVTSFDERSCLRGGLGRFPARDLMTLALAHAQRLRKFGA